jgi:hypothetical protein
MRIALRRLVTAGGSTTGAVADLPIVLEGLKDGGEATLAGRFASEPYEFRLEWSATGTQSWP